MLWWNFILTCGKIYFNFHDAVKPFLFISGAKWDDVLFVDGLTGFLVNFSKLLGVMSLFGHHGVTFDLRLLSRKVIMRVLFPTASIVRCRKQIEDECKLASSKKKLIFFLPLPPSWFSTIQWFRSSPITFYFISIVLHFFKYLEGKRRLLKGEPIKTSVYPNFAYSPSQSMAHHQPKSFGVIYDCIFE